MNSWRDLITGEEREVYEKQHAGYKRSLGEKPALIIVDTVRAFVGRPGLSLKESAKEWPTSCGPYAWKAIPFIAKLRDIAVERSWPIVYTTGQPGSASIFGGTVKGEIVAMDSPMDWPGAQDIPEEIAPPSGALVLPKPKASAFFGTPLIAFLVRNRVDTLIVGGGTTSGCVRATVVDAHMYGFNVFVVEEACFDRAELSHNVSLYEMNAKYADVISVEELE
jgi:maleamate amidohydrolase